MYNKYFGLTDKPFSIAPDPRYLFMSEQHREALAHLVYGVGQGGGFVLLTGEVGTGKTTVCRCLLEQIPENTRIAFILNPKLSTTELLATVCDELHIAYPEQPSLKQLNDSLNEFLLKSHAEGLKIVLMIDEAQNLSTEVLEQIRLLTNLETNKEKLLQIILIGQPELKDLLARHELRQLAQRITARFHLHPLDLEEAESYVLHRLEVSGFSENLFDKKAIKELYKRTAGVPRLINVLCDRAMLGAYARNKRQISADVVKQAASEVMGGDVHEAQADIIRPTHTPEYYWKMIAFGLATVLVLGIAVVTYLFKQQSTEQLPLVITPSSIEEESEQEQIIEQQPAQLEQIAKENQQLKNIISVLEEEHLEHPETLLPFLPPEIQSATRDGAHEKLFRLWHVEYQAERDGDACDFALQHQLRCETDTGGWWLLRTMDRPVILKLTSKTGRSVYGVLTSLDAEGKEVVLDFSGEELTLTREQISEYWTGEYYFIWQTPPDYQKPLTVSMSGLSVQWLLTRLALLDNLDLIVPPNAVFDDKLAERITRFQQQYSLVADGVAGPQTMIKLNTLTSKDIPTLSTSGGGI